MNHEEMQVMLDLVWKHEFYWCIKVAMDTITAFSGVLLGLWLGSKK